MRSYQLKEVALRRKIEKEEDDLFVGDEYSFLNVEVVRIEVEVPYYQILT